jgi:hypothetical protein
VYCLFGALFENRFSAADRFFICTYQRMDAIKCARRSCKRIYVREDLYFKMLKTGCKIKIENLKFKKIFLIKQI